MSSGSTDVTSRPRAVRSRCTAGQGRGSALAARHTPLPSGAPRWRCKSRRCTGACEAHAVHVARILQQQRQRRGPRRRSSSASGGGDGGDGGDGGSQGGDTRGGGAAAGSSRNHHDDLRERAHGNSKDAPSYLSLNMELALGLCYLGCLELQLPIQPQELVRWCKSGRVPPTSQRTLAFPSGCSASWRGGRL